MSEVLAKMRITQMSPEDLLEEVEPLEEVVAPPEEQAFESHSPMMAWDEETQTFILEKKETT